MNPTELELWLKENNFVTSEVNKQLFKQATEGLLDVQAIAGTRNDSNGVPINYGTGAHCWQSFSDAITLTKASSALEIGTNLGHGSAAMLALGVKQVYSIDISTRTETADAAAILKRRYPDRFMFHRISSVEFLESESIVIGCDFAFIDGGHEIEDVRTDIALCRKLGIKNLFFDDWFPGNGPGVRIGIKEAGLKVRAIFGNMCLCSEI